jgi:hypothetical protein
MRTLLVLAVAGLMLPRIGWSEDVARNVRFEFATTLNAVLSDTLDSRRNKPGDAVKARTSEDVKADGVVVIPRGAKLVGRVTEAQIAANKGEQARLGVVFERAELKDGRQVSLQARLHALAAPEGAAGNRAALAGGGFGGGFGSGSSAVGDMMSASSSGEETHALGTGRPKQENLEPSPGAIGGLNPSGALYASSRGVFGLEEISLEPNTAAGTGSSVILANARTVRLPSGTRMLLSVESAATR